MQLYYALSIILILHIIIIRIAKRNDIINACHQGFIKNHHHPITTQELIAAGMRSTSLQDEGYGMAPSS